MRQLWQDKLTRRLQLLRQLDSPANVFLFARIFLVAAIVPLIMRLKLSTVERLLEPRRLPTNIDAARVDRIIRYVDLAQQVGRPLISPKCLTRGLTLYTFLRRAGMEVTLDFGAGQQEGCFAAHCWLVRDGAPFLEPDDPRTAFATVYRIPARPQDSA